MVVAKESFAADALPTGNLKGTSGNSAASTLNSTKSSSLNNTTSSSLSSTLNNTVNNTTNNTVLKTSNTSNYNNSSLPKTGIEDSMPLVVLTVVLGISAIYAYKKIQDYRNI